MPIQILSPHQQHPLSYLRWKRLDRMPQMLVVVPVGILAESFFNQAWFQFSGVAETDLDSALWSMFMHADDLEEFYSLWQTAVTQNIPFQIQSRILHYSGEYRWCLLSGAPEIAGQDWVMSCVDAHELLTVHQEHDGTLLQSNAGDQQHSTELTFSAARRQLHLTRKQAQIRLNQYDAVDSLTGLMSRRAFKREAIRHLQTAKQQQQMVGLIVMDLDHLKHVNDAFGQSAGDYLLNVFGQRIQQQLPSTAQIARLGSDEFAVLLPNMSSQQQVLDLAHKISKQLERPIDYAEQVINVGTSMGCALYPQHSTHFSGLMCCADIALSDVKENGRGMTAMFNAQLLQHAQRSMHQLNLTRAILRDDCIFPQYQPKFCLTSGQIIGFEALLRWTDASGQLQYPTQILESFQHYELATKISHVMQHKILQDIANWQQAGRKLVPVSINIAPIEFLKDDCAERLLERLAQYQIAPEWVQVEITEHIFLHQGRDFVTRALSVLREKGIKIALDDFGTGYSSLTHLRDYAVDYLKIDCQFVQKMEADPAVFAIVKALCQLAPSFALEVVAEGIETTQQKDMLLSVGCAYGQGFLCNEAISAQQVLQLLEHV